MMVNICCSGSSGSTILAQLLDNHPDIVCGEELGLFSKPVVYRRYEYLRKRSFLISRFGISSNPYFHDRSILRNLVSYNLTKKKVWRWVRSSLDIQELSETIKGHVLQMTQKKIWAEKSPENIMTISDFISAFPRAKVIHIVRDPRDVVLSLMKRGLSLLSAAETWLVSVSCIQGCRQRENILEIRYEDLVCEPEKTMLKVAGFLGVVYDTAYLNSSTFASKNLKRSKGFESWSLKPSCAISDQAVGKYRGAKDDISDMFSMRLSEEFAHYIKAEQQYSLTDLAQQYGYDFTDAHRAICRNRSINTSPEYGLAARLLYSWIDIDKNMVRVVC